jgi:hypothetical protein
MGSTTTSVNKGEERPTEATRGRKKEKAAKKMGVAVRTPTTAEREGKGEGALGLGFLSPHGRQGSFQLHVIASLS